MAAANSVEHDPAYGSSTVISRATRATFAMRYAGIDPRGVVVRHIRVDGEMTDVMGHLVRRRVRRVDDDDDRSMLPPPLSSSHSPRCSCHGRTPSITTTLTSEPFSRTLPANVSNRGRRERTADDSRVIDRVVRLPYLGCMAVAAATTVVVAAVAAVAGPLSVCSVAARGSPPFPPPLSLPSEDSTPSPAIRASPGSSPIPTPPS
mmetsp:Transcript_62143/g.183694  ORF Transcript_62143/g.183694 Transcript_62143/m.183694 type:complete len:205 (-) Transcript_62143:734-1348(-)